MSNDPNSSEARGRRLKILREKTGLTSTLLAEKSGLSRGSISYWENGARGGLTRRGAEIMINTLTTMGLQCDIGWLWSGIGEEPKFVPSKNVQANHLNEKNISSTSYTHNLISSLEKETEIFLSLNKNSVIARVADDLMVPVLLPGDIVGGIWEPIPLLSSQKAFILSINDNLIARNIKKHDDDFEISHINKSLPEYLSLKKIDVSKIARIIRIWRY